MTEARRIASRVQAEASDPAVSAWVSANAGTGKTHVLVNRIIRLMLEGAAPERILCLTFTRAAAAEMSARLIEVLGRWVALDDEALRDEIAAMNGGREFSGLAAGRRLFARALETPGGLKVQTIHAFCERLLQRFPVEAGVAPGFSVLDPTAAKAALAAARTAVLAGHDGAGEVRRLIEAVAVHADLEELTRLIGKLIDERSRLGGALASDEAVEETLQQLAAFLGLAVDANAPDPGPAIAAVMSDDDMLAIADEMAESSKATDQKTAKALRQALATTDGEARLAVLSGRFLNKDGGAAADRSLFTQAMAHHGDRLGALSAEISRLADVQKAAGIYQASEALLRLAHRVIARYEHEKRLASGYDYDDLIARTLALLRESDGAQWVLYKLDGGLDHILIDEAQDTSRDQWEIVRLLADEFFSGEGAREGLTRTIFAVGDKKQSIFSFQGAEPRLFDQMCSYFAARLEALGGSFRQRPLETSFRSVEVILGVVDAVFNGDAAAPGVKADAGETIVHQAIRAGEPGLVEIWPVEAAGEEEPGDPRRRVAQTIAETITRWRWEREPLYPGGPPIRPRDILILLQRRPVLMPLLVKALKERGVPVAGPDRLLLGEHVAVRDLASLGRFVLQPGDDLALAETLKSPLLVRDDGAPFDDDDLFVIAHDRGRHSLWSALQRHAEAGAPYAGAVAQLLDWQRVAATSTAGAFYQRVLAAGGGWKALQARLGIDVVDAVENFLQIAFAMPREKVQSLREFLDVPGGIAEEFRRDMGEAAGEVRIMTVHGAKGLQAPIVFIADAAAPPGGGNRPGLHLVRTTDGVLPVWRLKKPLLPAALTHSRTLDELTRREEYNRLLYVAMTRARDRLYLAGATSKTPPSEPTWHDMVTAALRPRASAVMLADGREALRIEDSGTFTPPSAAPHPESEAPPLPAWALTPPSLNEIAAPWISPSAVRSGLRPEAESSPEAVASPLAGDVEWRFQRGRLVHRLLQVLPDLPPEARQQAALRLLAHAAPELDRNRHEALISEVLGVILAPAIAPLFAPGSRAEVPLVAEIEHPALGRFLISGRLDRIAVSEDEVLIADYKTNRPVPHDLADADPAHIAQLAAYSAGLKTIYPGRRVRAFLVWTDGPRSMEIPETILIAALTAA